MLTGTLDINTFVLALVGILTAFNTYYSRKTEKNTNSMKDALVASTRTTAHAEGREEQRLEGLSVAAAKAEGVLEGMKEK